MRLPCAGLVCLALAACGKAPGNDEPGRTASTAGSVAFSYHYDFRLPSGLIADAQEADARACEQLAPPRCRITGMTYRLDGSGQVMAGLDVRVAAAGARAFGRRSVQSIEAVGGALTGADIMGTDAAPGIAAATGDAAGMQADLATIDRSLARADLPQAERAGLTARRADLVGGRRETAAILSAAQESIATTPISFNYAAGSGVGLPARLGEAVHDGYLSLTWTLATVLTLLAYLGPPLLLLLLIALFWRRVGRRWWARIMPPPVVD